jgi:hypothetical protein
MKHRLVVLCALFAGISATAGSQVPGQVQAQAPAQAAGSFTIQCDSTLVSYLFTPTEAVMTYFCQTNATINGVAFKNLALSQVSEGNSSAATQARDWGVMVGALANGDEVFFEYQDATRRVGSTGVSGTMAYKIVGGTGSASGITGSGNCNMTGTVGKGNEQSCSGTYAIR